MIVFDKEIAEDELINAHNNNIVKFRSDGNEDDQINAEIVIGEYTFDNVYPDPLGVFTFNFKDIFKALINSEMFKDTIAPNIQVNGYVYSDSTLYLEQEVTYKVYIDGVEDPEEIVKNYVLFNSIEQALNYKDSIVETATDKINLRHQYQDIKNFHALTYFEGYPFDFVLYSDSAITATITNTYNASTMNVDLTKGANRIVLSDGSTDCSNEGDLLLRTGINKITIKVAGANTVTLYLTKKESECSPYFKYYKDKGGFGYFRAAKKYYKRTKSSTNGYLETTEDISEEIRKRISLGKSADTEYTFAFYKITKDELVQLQDMFNSPNIELYTEDIFELFKLTDWHGVDISNGQYIVKETEKEKFDVEVKINIKRKNLAL